MRVTIAVPVALVASANELARCVGYSEADGQTFAGATHQNGAGDGFAVASGVVAPKFVSDAVGPLSAPVWGADLEAAETAQALVRIWSDDLPVAAAPDIIAAYVGDDDKIAVDAMGLMPLG